MISLFSAQTQALDCHLQLNSTFYSNHNTYSKKKNQILLLDSLLNSNANTFYKLCLYVHTYLTYTTVDFSFQSFAQFLLFLWPHRGWYSTSSTLRNAGLYSVTPSSVHGAECGFLCCWWILKKFSSLQWEVTEQRGRRLLWAADFISCSAHTAGEVSSLNSRVWRVGWGVGQSCGCLSLCQSAGADGWWGDGTAFPQERPQLREMCSALSKGANHASSIPYRSMNCWLIGGFGYKSGSRLSLLEMTLCLTTSCSHNSPAAGWWAAVPGQNISFVCAGSEAMYALTDQGELFWKAQSTLFQGWSGLTSALVL